MSEVNPYAAPQSDSQTGTRGSFALSEEVRKLIATTATLMLVSGIVALIPATINLVSNEIDIKSIAVVGFLGIAPAFVAYAGLTLRSLAKPGNDRATLLDGCRQLYVAFLVKGIILLLVVAVFAITFLGVTARGIF